MGVREAEAECDPELGYEYDPTVTEVREDEESEWEVVSSSFVVCNTEPGVAPFVMTEADFQSLPLVPSAVTVQPSTGSTYVNLGTITYTSSAPQFLDAVVLGQPVRVRATPAEFTWGYGDGSDPLVTTDPGAPYPDHTVHHTYTVKGRYSITLTTSWTGEYSLDGGLTYRPVPGTATTTSAAPPLTVVELRSVLVDDPVG